MSGGAGYVLSKAALKILVENGFRGKRLCNQNMAADAEDVEIGRCLRKLKVVFGNSSDQFGRNRFFPFAPKQHLDPNIRNKIGSEVRVDMVYCLSFVSGKSFVEPVVLESVGSSRKTRSGVLLRKRHLFSLHQTGKDV